MICSPSGCSTHTFEASWATPYLRITSAAPESGKTVLLEVLTSICRAGWHAVNPSVAVLYRKVDQDPPTLLLDEMDNYDLSDRRDALAVLNAGYKRGAKVSRCTEAGELRDFSCFCPKAYAGLDDRALVPTLLSRSITIRMDAKRRSDHVGLWIAPLVEHEATELRTRCQAWAAHHIDSLRDHRPDLLELINRRAEVWWALLAIGEHVGGDWQERAREAARALGTGGDDADAPSQQVQLLTDVHAAFGQERTIFTEALLDRLNDLDESPWGARRKGEGLDARGLANLLRPFKIKPRKVRVGRDTRQGYHLDQFEDVFDRHLHPSGKTEQAEHPEHPAWLGEPNVPHVPEVPDLENGGHLQNLKDGERGKPMQLVFEEPLPDDIEVLPSGDTLTRSGDSTTATPKPTAEAGFSASVDVLTANREASLPPPACSDDGFLTFIRDRYRSGHLTRSEWLRRVALHSAIQHSTQPTLDDALPAELQRLKQILPGLIEEEQ